MSLLLKRQICNKLRKAKRELKGEIHMKTVIKTFFLLVVLASLVIIGGCTDWLVEQYSDSKKDDEVQEETINIENTENDDEEIITDEISKEDKKVETIIVCENNEDENLISLCDSDESVLANDVINTVEQGEAGMYDEEIPQSGSVAENKTITENEIYTFVTDALITTKEGFAVRKDEPLSQPIKILANEYYNILTQALGASYNLWGYGMSDFSISGQKLSQYGSNFQFDVALEDGCNSTVICKIYNENNNLIDGFEIEDSSIPHHVSIDLNSANIIRIEMENMSGNYTRVGFFNFDIY